MIAGADKQPKSRIQVPVGFANWTLVLHRLSKAFISYEVALSYGKLITYEIF